MRAMQTSKTSKLKVMAIVRKSRHLSCALLPVLHDVQNEFGHVPVEAVEVVADELNLSRAEVHGVVSFYHDFRQEQPANQIVEICRAEACQAVGARALQESLEKKFSTQADSPNNGGGTMLKAVYCFGNCACGPNIRIDGRIYGRVSPAGIDELFSKHLSPGGANDS